MARFVWVGYEELIGAAKDIFDRVGEILSCRKVVKSAPHFWAATVFSKLDEHLVLISII